MTGRRDCVDCVAEVITGSRTEGRMRPAPHPGPRCVTHHRAKVKRDRARASDRNLMARYGLSPEDYEALLAAQDGKCALCGRRIGVSKRAAVDHDHDCEVCGGGGCRACVRGLVDQLCNKDVLGRFGDDPARFRAMVDYLEHPPAKVVLSKMTV